MDAPLPFGLPGPTAMYLSLYAVTLTVHVCLMSYVLAGTAFAGADAALRRGRPAGDRPTAGALLRDWLPFALGAAITAGVAPLLFVQILYQRGFYTANLLLFHRWMALVPVLIVGFYLLYLLKSAWIVRRGPRARVAVSALAFACFVFAAWSWAENHVLSTADGAWVELYRTGAMTYREPTVLLRLAIWIGGAFPVMAALAGLQLHRAERRTAAPASPGQWRALAGAALGGFAIAALGALGWTRSLGAAERDAIWSAATRPYAIAAGIAIAAQCAAWLLQLRAGARRGRLVAITAAAAPATVLGVTAVREAVRIARVDLPALFAQHSRAAESGGLWLFVALLAVNTIAIGWLVSRVRTDVARGG